MNTAGPRDPTQPAASRFRPAQLGVLLLVLVTGTAVGWVLQTASTASIPPAGPAARPALVQADPRTLVTQPADPPRTYVIEGDQQAADPGQTHPRQQYSVTISRSDVPTYAAQAAVNLYSSEVEARAAMTTLRGLGQFGSELPMHDSLGDEAHLFAARAGDRSLVIGSVLWRDRNVVGYVFVYNPYPDNLPADAIERLARGNAYDDTMGIAIPIQRRIRGGG